MACSCVQFANVVASRAVTLRQAAVIAVITEFVGAVALGKQVTDTIRKKVIDIKLFVNQMDTLMLAMVASAIGSSSFLNFATANGMPVSTTHTTVGTLVGVAYGFEGQDAVNWGKLDKDNWSKGVVGIVISWVLAPILSGVMGAVAFLINKFLVLNYEDTYRRAIMFAPLNVFIAMFIVTYFMVYKGLGEYSSEVKGWEDWEHFLLAGGIAGFFAILSFFTFVPWLRKRLDDAPDDVEDIAAAMAKIEEQAKEHRAAIAAAAAEYEAMSDAEKVMYKVKKFFLGGLEHDVELEALENSAASRQAHVSADSYSTRTEGVYKYLNVLTSSIMGIAHGSNDVANAIGVLSTVVHVWDEGGWRLSKKVDVPIWILAYGGAFIDLGLIMKGHHIMRVLGNNLTKVSASRGFCADIGAMIAVLLASSEGWPVSTTQCITGATIFVGLCNRDSLASINWKMVIWCFYSWVITLPMAGAVSGLLFSFVSNSPKRLNCGVKVLDHSKTVPNAFPAKVGDEDVMFYNLKTCVPEYGGTYWNPTWEKLVNTAACPSEATIAKNAEMFKDSATVKNVGDGRGDFTSSDEYVFVVNHNKNTAICYDLAGKNTTKCKVELPEGVELVKDTTEVFGQ